MPGDINPSGTETDTLPSADGGGLPLEGQNGFIPLTKYEQDMAVERKRRAGQEKAHAKQMKEMQDQIDGLRSTSQQGSGTSQRPTVDLSRLDPDDPRDAVTLVLYQNQAEWQADLKNRYQSEQYNARLNEAMQEATLAGVPIDDLETDSPEAIRASTKDYLQRKELSDMKAKIEKLEADKEIAYTTGRAETGATVVSTATGGAQRINPNLQEIRDQRKVVLEEQAEAVRKNNLVDKHNTTKALKILAEQEQAILSRGR